MEWREERKASEKETGVSSASFNGRFPACDIGAKRPCIIPTHSSWLPCTLFLFLLEFRCRHDSGTRGTKGSRLTDVAAMCVCMYVAVIGLLSPWPNPRIYNQPSWKLLALVFQMPPVSAALLSLPTNCHSTVNGKLQLWWFQRKWTDRRAHRIAELSSGPPIPKAKRSLKPAEISRPAHDHQPTFASACVRGCLGPSRLACSSRGVFLTPGTSGIGNTPNCPALLASPFPGPTERLPLATPSIALPFVACSRLHVLTSCLVVLEFACSAVN